MNLLNAQTVATRLSVSRASLYRLMRDDLDFPPPIRLGKGRVAWLETEIDGWINRRAGER